ncbi:YhgE/Pip domain-containing protein [Leifsonia sp. YAF41]|uniref:YhgE/Pip domain-containing protein n=1 Tax=Leifsonia sp. YAF41 TaxID=3233086 RepID=UPI003F9D9230
MSTPLARLRLSRSTGRVSALSILGIILVPLVVAGILIWSLWNPADRLHQVNAAIVNNDAPVTIDGQIVPLGRQLSAGLVGGVDSNADAASSSTSGNNSESDSAFNYNWVITDADDAASGLASGRFTAVVTIPENFSASATSFSGAPADATQAVIDVATSDKSRLVDDAISQVITTTAAGLVGNQLTTSYLTNIYVGFNTLGDQLGEAATGAGSLATGLGTLADGTAKLADGSDELSSGASGLADGMSQLSGGLTQLSGGLTALQQGTANLPAQSAQLAAGAQGIAGGIGQVNDTLAGQASALQGQLAALGGIAAEVCTPPVADPALCQSVQTQIGAIATVVGTAAGTLDAVSSSTELSGAADQVAGGMAQFAAGMPALANGIGQSASGAGTLATAGEAVSGGASSLSDGVSSFATGVRGVSDGTASITTGAGSLATGLTTAVDQLPHYSESDQSKLAEVVAQPVVTDNTGGLSFGTTGVPFYAVLALWLGALASLIVLRAVPADVLGSTKSSLALAVKAWLPAALVGVVQGLLVTALLVKMVDLDLSGWFAFTGIAVLIGAAFAATNQALNALFGGAGRFVSMIVALVLIGTSIIATAPAALDRVMTFLPVQPAIAALQASVTSQSAGGAVVGLVLWTLGALGVTTFAIARRRTVTARQLVPATA